jgi:hypothetical protein
MRRYGTSGEPTVEGVERGYEALPLKTQASGFDVVGQFFGGKSEFALQLLLGSSSAAFLVKINSPPLGHYFSSSGNR